MRRVNIDSNLFRYTGSSAIIHHYQVTFKPEILRKNMFNVFLDMASNEKDELKVDFAYDGLGMLVSYEKFPDRVLRQQIRNGELEAHIEYKNSYDMNDRQQDPSILIQCMDCILRFYQKQMFWSEKKKMISDGYRSDLDTGLELHIGISASFKITNSCYYLNVDPCYVVFYKAMDVVNLANDIARNQRTNLNREQVDSQFWKDFEKFINGLRIETIHRKKNCSFKVIGLEFKTAKNVFFTVNEQEVSVYDYFAKEYFELKNPELPLIRVKKKGVVLHIPMEVTKVCSMQKYMKKLNEPQTAAMMKEAGRPPADRFRTLMEKAEKLKVLDNENLKRFGFVFDNRFEKIEALELPLPTIEFSNTTKIPENGAFNLKGAKALKGVKISTWSVFVFREDDFRTVNQPNSFDKFCKIAADYGINLPGQPKVVHVNTIDEYKKAPKSQLNIVVLRSKTAVFYEEIKMLSETVCGVFTQCVTCMNLPKMLNNITFMSNVLIKIVSKMGGVNFTVKNMPACLKTSPTMIVGIDVSHPGIGAPDSAPTLVSVVATCDSYFAKYRTELRIQKRREDVVEDLGPIIINMCLNYYNKMQVKPERILVFRDGVNESIFTTVTQEEINKIREGCAQIDGFVPKITYIVAQKKQGVRFKTENDQNVAPGTVVNALTHPILKDFYMVAHDAIKGTAKPCRYIVTHDECSYSPQELYEICLSQCYMYGRATKGVSFATPVYYAKLASARAKTYLMPMSDDTYTLRAQASCFKEVDSLFYL